MKTDAEMAETFAGIRASMVKFARETREWALGVDAVLAEQERLIARTRESVTVAVGSLDGLIRELEGERER